MKTAEEILKEYGNWNKEGLAEWHKDCIIAAMEEYAQQQVKKLNIPAVIPSVCVGCIEADYRNEWVEYTTEPAIFYTRCYKLVRFKNEKL